MLRYPSPESLRAISNHPHGRSLLIRGRKAEVVVHIAPELWSTAERLRDDFKLKLSREAESGFSEFNELELLLAFIGSIIPYVPMHCDSFPIKLVLKQLFLTLCSKHLDGCDPHSCLKEKLETMQIRDALRIYYDAHVELRRGEQLKPSELPTVEPALLREAQRGSARLMAVFGGQGNTEDLLEELLELDQVYHALSRPFLKAIAPSILQIANEPEAHEYTSKGFDILRWIDKPESRPPREYLFSAAISLPLVGLIQLLNYYLTFRILGMSAEQLLARFVGATGHSQGIVAAVVIAKSQSEEDFVANSIKALQILFWIGLRSQQVYPEMTLNPQVLSDSISHGEGVPTPMLAISNLALSELQAQVDISNKFLGEGQKIEISLLNGPRAFVCSGPPQSLYGLNLLLRKLKAPASLDQARIPFSERKLKFSTRFLPITTPFHCSYLQAAVPLILQDIELYRLSLAQPDFCIPVIATDTGLLLSNEGDLMRSLVEQICIRTVKWSETIRSIPISHLLDFGPGHASGIGALTHKNIDGSGIQVILAGTIEAPSQTLHTRTHLFGTQLSSVRYGQNWGVQYRPRLVKNLADGHIYIDTKFSRLLGRQPLMVAGMTPSTADADFMAACMNAGYHIELSGGAHFTEKMLRDKIDQIVQKVAPGLGLTLNVLFLNQRLWSFQFPLAQTLRQEGVPLEGFTIAAGVPSLDSAHEMIAALRQAGIRHISFKPGSTEQIMQVVNIAKQNHDMPIIMQWTGGRAGGHHSFEDFHQPILDTYAAIRSCDNICLIAGSGFGDGEGTFPYLDGSWSLRYNYPAMPFDGILLGSRMLVAKEGKASTSVKETIVAAAGIENEGDWVQSYKKPVGGVLTVISEMGEPIHKIATRAVVLWKELDDKVFSLPREKRLDYLHNNKAWIIERLNRDAHKVWFGRKETGSVAELSEMTYFEVADRLAQLVYVRHQSRWIDPSYKRLFLGFMQRVEERAVKAPCKSILPDLPLLQDPHEVLLHFFQTYPNIRDQLLASEDCLHFVALCRKPDQKPVPFVPLFDDNFEFWFKKDSLWQSEDIDAVIDQDPQRVCILQGPVAVKYSKVVNEPAKDILDGIVSRHIEYILERDYGGDRSQIKGVNWFGGISPANESNAPPSPLTLPESSKIRITEQEASSSNPNRRTIALPELEADLPGETDWFLILSENQANWLHALLFADYLLQEKHIVKNCVRWLFRPRPALEALIEKDPHGTILQISVIDSKRQKVLVTARLEQGKITVRASYIRSPLVLHFVYNPANSIYPLQEDMTDRNYRIKLFYWSLWFGDEREFVPVYNADPLDAVFVARNQVDSKTVGRFCRIVGNFASLYTNPSAKKHLVPMDYAIVMAWQAVIKCLFPQTIDGDLLRLVHLSNKIRYVDKSRPICEGDFVTSEAYICSIRWTPQGKIVEIVANLMKGETTVIRVLSTFLYRGRPSLRDLYFEKDKDVTKKIVISSDEQLAVLKSKTWIEWNGQASKLNVGSQLLFSLQYYHEPHLPERTLKRVDCTGVILLKAETKEYLKIGQVRYGSSKVLTQNPVLAYLNKVDHSLEKSSIFEGEGYALVKDADSERALKITSASTNQTYSDISGDHNPIHTSALFADLANLPGTITHGMWTSAAVRSLVETYACDNQPLRVTEYEVSFVGMLLPNEQLSIKLHHVGMKDGNKLVKVLALNQGGEKVLEGMAEVEQPRTAYVFTGQGSQEVGMGMELYKTSTVAREIWDQADHHFFTKFGFSILDIVRRNPTQLTVYFGGPRGKSIRENYRSLVYQSIVKDDHSATLPLFPTITDECTSYTFNSPIGLLYATQFTQPALTLMEKAAYEDLKARGLANPQSPFAGHSLGEYAALASVGDVLSIETLCDIVFYRGLTMQVVVKRDSKGRSQYGMVAVNPMRVAPTFSDQALRLLIAACAEVTQRLIEIVNYNVEKWQYVVAGELIALDCLCNVLNHIHSSKFDLVKLLAHHEPKELATLLRPIIKEALQISLAREQSQKHLILERGIATIPLAGLDVPFHSTFLRAGVPSFRKCLESRIHSAAIDVSILRGNYIPNLTGVPFDISEEYLKVIWQACKSPLIGQILNTWSEEEYKGSAAKVQELARLILIELLAYQFASPVRWIETQDQLFKNLAIERLIEIGPTPVLSGMAERTLKIKYQEYDDALNYNRLIWSYSNNRSEIYYKVESGESAGNASNTTTSNSSAIAKASLPPPPTATATAAVVPAKASLPRQRQSTLPFELEELLQILIGLKMKRSPLEIALTKSIKELSGGKSTMQNELLADLQKEFGDNFPDKAEELPLKDLAAQVRPVFTKAPGKLTAGMISKLFSSKMPAGFSLSAAKDLLSNEFGLEAGAADVLLLFSLSFEPSSRLPNEEAAQSWLRTNVANYFEAHGLQPLSLETRGDTPEALQISSAELEKIQSKHRRLLRQQIELFASYIEQNLLEFRQAADDKTDQIILLQKDLDLWLSEHGNAYADGIRPLFSWLKVRKYDSSWNWARQDVFMLYYDIIFGRLKNVDREVTAKCLHVMNRSSQDLVDFMEYHIFKSPEMLLNSENSAAQYRLARQYGEMLIEQVKSSLNRPPIYKDVSFHTRPCVMVSSEGGIKYEEVRRMGVNSFETFVKEMRRGSTKLGLRTPAGETLPLIYIRARSKHDCSMWTFNQSKTSVYLDTLEEMASAGVSFANRMALMTGCGRGSIGGEILKGLLSGGAKVIVTTSSFNRATVDYFRSIYECHGARSSSLIIAPFNQGSSQDVEALVDYIYSSDPTKGLGWDLDYIIPFAALSENGRELTELDSKSELSHRIMLTNLLRILGTVALYKRRHRIETRPAQAVLPMSPNHGVFGGDGLYGESKIGLETMFNRWHSESWHDYLTIVGAVIGWTRGTGLMSDNNVIAEEIEELGVRTFSSKEMAFNILGMMHPKMVCLCEEEPLYGDLNGGMNMLPNLNEVAKEIRSSIMNRAKICKALADDERTERLLQVDQPPATPTVIPRANLKFDYPPLPHSHRTVRREMLRELLDLDHLVVVTGFGEVGPWGSSRTRWQMESEGELSLEGCIEMAWMMGMIRFQSGIDPSGQPFSSWVDVASGQPVQDVDIKARYETRILQHSGIRLIEPAILDGYDPNRKNFLQEIVIDYDMAPIETSKEEAEQFRLLHGSHVDTYDNGNGRWTVKLRRGAVIYVPKALRFDRLVAGQVPTGWDAERYGVPKEIVQQVDPITLYVLVSTVEALVASGITDPYEFYQYVHLCEVGNTSGGGVGGLYSFRRIFRGRFMEKPASVDVLQESFINTMAAWVNLLLLSSSGPIKTPVGACATAVQSVEIGVETILSGKARVVIVGGYDDVQEESSNEFASMQATSNAVEELAKGRQPDEMSRPSATSRSGFMESQGAGIQVLMTASLAIQMGCPIYGIIALTNTATDKEGRSIPAPGQGILTTARSIRTTGGCKPRILDLEYRYGELRKALSHVAEWLAQQLAEIEQEAVAYGEEEEEEEEDNQGEDGEGDEVKKREKRREAFIRTRTADVHLEARRREDKERRFWGVDFWHQDPRVAPIEGGLSIFGLTIDDIGVASFHGTGTKANDVNESDVVNKQLVHLGRTRGNPLPSIFQKYLTGHPKGAAAAWMLNGLLQVLRTGIIPGNRNADNIDEKLADFSYILYPSRTIHTTGLRAGILKSFGFGQVGGEVLVVHPDYLLSALSPSELASYTQRRQQREAKTYRYLHDSITGLASMVQVKHAPPYTQDLESQIYLNPLARASFDQRKNTWTFTKSTLDKSSSSDLLAPQALLDALRAHSSAHPAGVGVDVQLICELNADNDAFIQRNFTLAEQEYCRKQPDPQSSFAGRWAAKEAILKALCSAHGDGHPSWLRSAGSPLNLIEILPSASGAPQAILHPPVVAPNNTSDGSIKVSISHSGSYAIAFASL